MFALFLSITLKLLSYEQRPLRPDERAHNPHHSSRWYVFLVHYITISVEVTKNPSELR